MATYEYSYPSVLESEERMLDDLQTLLDENSVVGRIKNHFMVVVSEAFTNALVHANNLNPERRIKVVISINKTRLSADIHDQGRDGLEGISSKKPPTSESESGRGVNIIRHYADSVSFIQTRGGGLKVSITIDREDEKITDKAK